MATTTKLDDYLALLVLTQRPPMMSQRTRQMPLFLASLPSYASTARGRSQNRRASYTSPDPPPSAIRHQLRPLATY